MCDGFAMYSRRVNGLSDVKGCSVLSTSELNKLRGDLDALTERLMIRDEEIVRLKETVAFWRDVAMGKNLLIRIEEAERELAASRRALIKAGRNLAETERVTK